MINFQGVTKQYGSAPPVLDDVSFVIDKGTFTYLVGSTGSGKTTIFRLIINDLVPSSGSILLGELETTSISKAKITEIRRRVGVVFQDLKLLLDRTVLENVILPLEFAGMNKGEMEGRAEEILKEVGLSGKEDQFPAQLSGGERQRVAIARALIFDPEIILADEPTGNLDTKTSFQILELLKNINQRGTTVFMATHDDKLIDRNIDRVIVLEKGKVIEDRKPSSSHSAKKESVQAEKEEKHEHSDKKTSSHVTEKHEKEEKHEEKDKEEDEVSRRQKIKLATLAAAKPRR